MDDICLAPRAAFTNGNKLTFEIGVQNTITFGRSILPADNEQPFTEKARSKSVHERLNERPQNRRLFRALMRLDSHGRRPCICLHVLQPNLCVRQSRLAKHNEKEPSDTSLPWDRPNSSRPPGNLDKDLSTTTTKLTAEQESKITSYLDRFGFYNYGRFVRGLWPSRRFHKLLCRTVGKNLMNKFINKFGTIV